MVRKKLFFTCFVNKIIQYTETKCKTTADIDQTGIYIEDWEDIGDVSKKCVFCESVFRTKNRLYQSCKRTKSGAKRSSIRQILQIENSTEKLQEIEDSTYISYHSSCLSEYEHKLFYEKRSNISSATTTSNVWSYRRILHEKSFKKVIEYVNEKLIEEKGVRNLADIYSLYSSVFREENTEGRLNLNHTVYTRSHLLKKIFRKFPNLSKTVYKHRTYLHRSDLSIEELHQIGFGTDGDLLSKIKMIAFEIRQKVKDMTKRNLPKNNISVKNIHAGECDIPKELYSLIRCLLSGPRDSKNERKEIKVTSICNSIIFSMSNGMIKPSTCLSLGLVTKSLTGSRRMIEILNRMGHCISYTVVEELETELAYGCGAETNLLPGGLIAKNSELRTHVAFDNFDKYVETRSGKDTLHDTVGIAYQNIVKTAAVENILIAQFDLTHESDTSVQRRRKYFSSFDNVIEPYIRKTQIMPPLIGGKEEIPECLQTSIDLNHLWMISHALNIGKVLRWSAWNSQRIIDPNPVQNIGYLPNINLSPTSDAVVLKTLKNALSIAEECGQKYIIVTYDLAIACKAYKIQADMSPDFDRVFITLGAFHIQLSFFKVNFYFSYNI